MSLMIMKSTITIGIKGAIPDLENAKTYLDSVEEQFKGFSKVYASTLIMKMPTTKYDRTSNIREHAMMMNNMAAKLKHMEMEISEGFLVHFIMTSLPFEFEPFKINYNTQKEKWTMSEHTAMCVQKEERLKAEKKDYVHHVSASMGKRKFQEEFKFKNKVHFTSKRISTKSGSKEPKSPDAPVEPNDIICSFCK